jgi:hypothetical protein
MKSAVILGLVSFSKNHPCTSFFSHLFKEGSRNLTMKMLKACGTVSDFSEDLTS